MLHRSYSERSSATCLVRQGHASHLVISCDDRKRLVGQIDSDFGAKLAAKDAGFGVAQAQLFREKLLEFKCAEEPR